MRPIRKLVKEDICGEVYEYYPLGKHVVLAPGVCGGRPTFKGTRLEVRVTLDLLAAGWSAEAIVQEYQTSGITTEAITEAVHIAADALSAETHGLAA